MNGIASRRSGSFLGSGFERNRMKVRSPISPGSFGSSNETNSYADENPGGYLMGEDGNLEKSVTVIK